MSINLPSESPFRTQLQVLRALVLRDMKTRFGTGLVSYVIAIGIPFLHLVFMMVIPLSINAVAPIGLDYGLFVATGLLPYILCLYPSRMTMLCLVDGASLLGFPIVKSLDVMLARACLEIIIAFSVILFFGLFLLLFRVDIVPYNAAEATGAILSTILLGIGLGLSGAIFFKLARAWLFIQLTILIVMYLTSGAIFMPRTLPPELRFWIWFNPLFHCVEWLRLAYYQGYGEDMLSRTYLLSYATALIAFALAAERAIRGRMLQL